MPVIRYRHRGSFMFSQFIKPVLQSLLALALVALLFQGVQLLRHEDPPEPSPDVEQTEADALPDHEAELIAPDEHGKSASEAIGEWRPDVDQVIDQLEDILISDIPQQQMNLTMANLNSVYDTKLYLVFIDYLATLPPAQVKTALKEQQTWLQKRKEQTAAAFAENEGGSLASYNAGETYLQVTRQRLEDLEQKLPH